MAVHRYRNDNPYHSHVPGFVRVDGPSAPCGVSAEPGEIIEVEGLMDASGWTRTDRPKSTKRKATKATKTARPVKAVAKPAESAPAPDVTDTPPSAGEED